MLTMIEDHRTKSLAVYSGGQYVGLVGQNPNDSRVMNPGKWFATLHTVDGGVIGSGSQESRSLAMRWFIVGYNRQWSYNQWMEKGNQLQ